MAASPHSSPHVAVLLAAGGSSRLGYPKQLIKRAGETLLHRSARLLVETRPRITVVVLGAHADRLAREVHDLPVRIAVNAGWQSGLASSLQTASRALQEQFEEAATSGGAASERGLRVLLALCDQPALESHHLRALLNSPACAATGHGTRLGVPAVLDACMWQKVHELAGDRGFSMMLSSGGCTRIDAPELSLDLDVPADIAVAIAQGTIDSPHAAPTR